MLKIWGRRDSFNLQKVMWCVAELGIAYERIDAGGVHGVTDTPEYLALNPNGRVPTIEDDGFVLWESNAITQRTLHGYPFRRRAIFSASLGAMPGRDQGQTAMQMPQP